MANKRNSRQKLVTAVAYYRTSSAANVGENKDTSDDQTPEVHAAVVRKLYWVASYFVANVSSPNTPGLRRLQDKEPLTQIVQAIKEAMESEGGSKPLFVKIDPDLTLQAIDDVVRVVVDNDLTGIVAALLAVLPHMVFGNASVPFTELAVMLGIVLVVGFASGFAAVRATLKAPLLSALRGD